MESKTFLTHKVPLCCDACFCLQTDALPPSGATSPPHCSALSVILQEHKMVFPPHQGEISPINMLPHLLSFLKHHPRCHISGDVDAASNKMSSLLARREFAFTLIHIHREGKLLAWCSCSMSKQTNGPCDYLRLFHHHFCWKLSSRTVLTPGDVQFRRWAWKQGCARF